MRARLHTIRQITFVLTFLLTLVTATVSAHIKNDASQFPDIEFSDARYDIVILVGAGIIPETPVFEPDSPLLIKDLAVWAALYNNLGEGGETPDTDKLAKVALENNLVTTLDGPASYADINRIFFQGALTVDPAATAPTKADAAVFIAEKLSAPEGASLLEKRGLQPGPTGAVTAVESRANTDGGSSYFITLNGSTMPMYAHGRVANGPTDLLQWKGRQVRKSFIRKQGDLNLWMYLEAEPVQAVVVDTATKLAQDAAKEQVVPESNSTLLYGLVVGVLVLGALLFFRRKRG